MYNNYTNFVKACSSARIPDQESSELSTTLSGEEARRIYLNEIKTTSVTRNKHHDNFHSERKQRSRDNQPVNDIEVSDRNLFISVENDDVDTLRRVLDINPDKINILDDYGWSLLMVACQANSIEVVKELLIRGIDTSVRDKAGNSARSLVIKNKNLKLVDLLLSYKNKEVDNTNVISTNCQEEKITNFFCETCNMNVKTHKNIHLSSTIHNINLSKGKKIPTNYVIPESNRGFQIMLKVGWDKESGLGPDGSGPKYPIKTVQKKDRKGLGHGKRPLDRIETEETVKQKNKKTRIKDYEHNRKMEVNFRRQFY